MTHEVPKSKDLKGSIKPKDGAIDILRQVCKNGAESTAVKSEEITRKHGDSWSDEEYNHMKTNLGELQLLYDGFQKNCGNGKALPSSFKSDETFSKFIHSYNDQRDKYAKELPRVNAQIDAHNKSLAEGVSKLQRLQLPPKLEFLKPGSSEARDLVTVAEKRSSGSYWDALKSMDSTKFLKLCKTAFVTMLLASCPTDAVKIQGNGCSIESRFWVAGYDPSLQPLANALGQQFNKVMPTLVEKYAADPCDKSYETMRLTFTRLPKGYFAISQKLLPDSDATSTKTIQGKEVLFDPNKRARISPEGLLTHELAHLAQNYPYYMRKDHAWFDEGMAEYARYKFGPAEKDDRQSLRIMPGDHFRDGYRVTAGFLLWLEKHKRNDIVDRLHRRMQRGTFTEKAFLQLTGQTVDELWKEYQEGEAELQNKEKREAYKRIAIYTASLLVATIGINELARRCVKRAPRSLAEPDRVMESGEPSSQRRTERHED